MARECSPSSQSRAASLGTNRHEMTVITVVAALTCTAVLMPAIAELVRARQDRHNPIRKLRIQTRRSQLPSASGSFVGSR